MTELSLVSLADLLTAAVIGFNKLNETCVTSEYAELAAICERVLNSLS